MFRNFPKQHAFQSGHQVLATHLDAPRELTYEIDEIYICEDNSNALALPPTLRRRCHWHSRRRDGAEPLHTAFYHDALQLRGCGGPARSPVRDLVSARERRSLASNQMVSRRDYTPSGGARPIHSRYGSASHRPFDTNLDG